MCPHIHTKDIDGNLSGALCIDRKVGTCIVLLSGLMEVDKLVAIARSQGISEVVMIVPDHHVADMRSRGWLLEEEKKVMVRRL